MYILLALIYFILFGFLFISYFIYPIVINFIKDKSRDQIVEFPLNTVIHVLIPCYNEEAVIEAKIRNSMQICYPREFKVYVIVDESEDQTSSISNKLKLEFSNLIVMDKNYRKGKNDSINYFYDNIKPNFQDILFFTDANTFFQDDSFLKLWDELLNGAKVVGGSMMYVDQFSNSAKSEGMYWKYEEWIRINENKFGRTITMNGGNMAMISGYFERLPLFVPNDFDIPIRLVSHNKTAFAKDSIGIEKAIGDMVEELKRKERMANRQMNAIIYRWSEFSSITKLQIVFHKVIRWLAIPIFSFITIIGILLFHFWGYLIVFLLVILLVWACVIISIVLSKLFNGKISGFSTINYAFLVHLYAFKGVLKAFNGGRVISWEKATTNR